MLGRTYTLGSTPLALAVISAAATLALAGCGGAAQGSTADATTADVATADAAKADAVTADGPLLDGQASETTTADGAGSDQLPLDAAPDVAAASPAESACAAYGAMICAAVPACCGGVTPSNCAQTWTAACLKLGWADADDALSNKLLQQVEAAKATCDQALQAATQSCDRAAVGRALSLCLRTWTDPAKIGQPCAAPVELSCAAGAGRCTAKTTDLYQCTQAVGEGSSCSLAQPCLPGMECLDSGLTRAKTCGKPGSTCNLADKCWDGWECENGKCEAGSTTLPATCAKDQDCPTTHACQSAKCAPKLCK